MKDLDDLKEIHRELTDLQRYEVVCMVELYNSGYSWAEIGEAVGMTRQGARQKCNLAGYKTKKEMVKVVREIEVIKPRMVKDEPF